MLNVIENAIFGWLEYGKMQNHLNLEHAKIPNHFTRNLIMEKKFNLGQRDIIGQCRTFSVMSSQAHVGEI